MFRNLLSNVEKINSELDNDILEISVKQSRMSMSFQDMSILSFKDFRVLDSYCNILSISEVTAFSDVLHVHFSNLSYDMLKEYQGKCPLMELYDLIFKLQDVLCTCPALEYVVSDAYVKVYIDLPNVHVKDVAKLDEIFSSEGVLEINNQRPYVLYVKDW